jgi:hypothetical protein
LNERKREGTFSEADAALLRDAVVEARAGVLYATVKQ